LRNLDVSDNPFEDVTPLISLPTLEGLNISHTKVTQVVGLRGCGTLRAIRAVGCKLDDADGLSGSKITLEQ
jgi:Leucine-rich repeat (LRR) protein